MFMAIFTYPLLLILIILIIVLMVTSFFVNKGEWILVSIAIILTAIYLVFSLIFGFDYLEIIITLLAIAIIMMLISILKRKMQR